jgi:hypothetical protein
VPVLLPFFLEERERALGQLLARAGLIVQVFHPRARRFWSASYSAERGACATKERGIASAKIQRIGRF